MIAFDRSKATFAVEAGLGLGEGEEVAEGVREAVVVEMVEIGLKFDVDAGLELLLLLFPVKEEIEAEGEEDREDAASLLLLLRLALLLAI